MRICIVMEYHPDDLVGGSEIQVFSLARHFAGAGNDVSYVCQRYRATSPTEETLDGVRILRVLRWHRVFRFLSGPTLFLALHRLKPDIIYQRFASPYTGLAALSARFIKAPFVWSCAEDVSVEGRVFLRSSAHRTGRGVLGRIKAGCLRLDALVNQFLFEKGVAEARAIVAQNTRQADLLARNYGRQAELIPNGVEFVQNASERSATPLVLWLNNLRRGKRPEAFIQLARALGTSRPGIEFAMVGGRADDAYLRDLKDLAAHVPGLVLYGPVSHRATTAWFQRAWVYVLTSEGEGFPNVMLQSWAANTPLVSVSIDPDGLIEREGLGLLSGTQEQLQEDVLRLLDDADLRERLATRSYAFALEHFELSRIAERYLELFQSLTTDRGEPGTSRC